MRLKNCCTHHHTIKHGAIYPFGTVITSQCNRNLWRGFQKTHADLPLVDFLTLKHFSLHRSFNIFYAVVTIVTKWLSKIGKNGEIPKHECNSDVLKYFNRTVQRISKQPFCSCDACKIRNKRHLEERNEENSKIKIYNFGLSLPPQITFSKQKILENKKDLQMLNELDYSSVFQSIFYVFLRSAQRRSMQPLYSYLEEGIEAPKGMVSEKIRSMRPFLDSFEIVRARTRYGPIEINSVLDFEKVPKSWENHFAILLPEMSSYIPFTKRFLMSVHLSENCLSPQMLQDYCYGRFDFPGKINAFIETRKQCTKCFLQQQVRSGRPYAHPHVSLPSHFFIDAMKNQSQSFETVFIDITSPISLNSGKFSLRQYERRNTQKKPG